VLNFQAFTSRFSLGRKERIYCVLFAVVPHYAEDQSAVRLAVALLLVVPHAVVVGDVVFQGESFVEEWFEAMIHYVARVVPVVDWLQQEEEEVPGMLELVAVGGQAGTLLERLVGYSLEAHGTAGVEGN